MEVWLSEALSGILMGNGHRLVQRVYHEDTDFSGVVYHARHLHFLERGRTDYLRCLGVQQGGMDFGEGNVGLAFVVRHMDIDFKAPARMDDIIEISTSPHHVGGAKLVFDQQIHSQDVLLVSGRVTIAVINAEGRPRRLPQAVADLFRLKP
jgi:acyl-CoA thioester hydrolase